MRTTKLINIEEAKKRNIDIDDYNFLIIQATQQDIWNIEKIIKLNIIISLSNLLLNLINIIKWSVIKVNKVKRNNKI